MLGIDRQTNRMICACLYQQHTQKMRILHTARYLLRFLWFGSGQMHISIVIEISYTTDREIRRE